MKCNLEILEQNNINYSFGTLLVGIQYGVINNVDVANYAVKYLIMHPDETNPMITELACVNHMVSNIESVLIEVLKLKSCVIVPGTKDWIFEERKVRFCLLFELKQNIINKSELLERITEVYADFNYPFDMEDFIYYMPAKDYDPAQHTFEENQDRLLDLFDSFLQKEKGELSI